MFRLSLATVIATVCLFVSCPGAWAQAAVEEPPVAVAVAAPVDAVAGADAQPHAAAHLRGTYDTGSTAWILVSAALVFFMMPGLALFYGGMVQTKNVLNMFMLVMICVPIVAIEWVAYGYNMAFAVPSAIALDAGVGPDGKELPKHSYLGWDPGLVFLSSFAD